MKSHVVWGVPVVILVACSGAKKPTDESTIKDTTGDVATFAPESDTAETSPPANVFIVSGKFDSVWTPISSTTMSQLDNVFSPAMIGAWQIRFQNGTCALQAVKFDPTTGAVLSSQVLDNSLVNEFPEASSCPMTLTTRGNSIFVQTCDVFATFEYTFDPTSGTATPPAPVTSAIWTEGTNWSVPLVAADVTPTSYPSVTLSQVWVDPLEPATLDPLVVQGSPVGTGDELASATTGASYGRIGSPNPSIVVCGSHVYEIGTFESPASQSVDDWSLGVATDAGDATTVYAQQPSLPGTGVPFSDIDRTSSVCANAFVYTFDPPSGIAYGAPIQSDGSLGAWFTTTVLNNGSPMSIVALEPEFVVAVDDSGTTYLGGWQRVGFGTVTTTDAGADGASMSDSIAIDASDTDVALDTAPNITPYTEAQCTASVGAWCASLNACLPTTGCNYLCEGTTPDGQTGIQCFGTKPTFSLVCDVATIKSGCP